MNKTLEISAMQYDFHTLLKVSDICGLTGEIGFHDTDTGYLVSFPDDDGKAEQRMAEYKKRLVDLENNTIKVTAPSTEISSAEGAVFILYSVFPTPLIGASLSGT